MTGAALLVAAALAAASAAGPAGRGAPTFADEFDGANLDAQVWSDWEASFQGSAPSSKPQRPRKCTLPSR